MTHLLPKWPFPRTKSMPSFRTRFSRRAARTPRLFRWGSRRPGGRLSPSQSAPTGRFSFPKPVLSSALSESRTESWWSTFHGFRPDNGEKDLGPNDEERNQPDMKRPPPELERIRSMLPTGWAQTSFRFGGMGWVADFEFRSRHFQLVSDRG